MRRNSPAWLDQVPAERSRRVLRETFRSAGYEIDVSEIGRMASRWR
ncbi:hypothetical protein RE6C_04973 [Rhodopirellula europaea 6C]|uniref:Uncharacterized protein n=1 Tax=Rhodopirellula europaea 6C TaxID=1263867 RepID=M2A4H7_9BACT|nr:hypothetical protein RE6C_04973 [Rhodopirellula europaea 6C]